MSFFSLLSRPQPPITSTLTTQLRFATKKAGGSSKNGRDSPGQRLGLKVTGNAPCQPGNIIVRQRGTVYHAGINVKTGRDWTLFATNPGFVTFDTVRMKASGKKRKFISVLEERRAEKGKTMKESEWREYLQSMGLKGVLGVKAVL